MRRSKTIGEMIGEGATWEGLLAGAEEFRRFCLRRRGREGRYWMRRRPPARMLDAAGVERAQLGPRGGGLFRTVHADASLRAASE